MERLYFYYRRPTPEQVAEAERLGAKLRDARACQKPPYKRCDEAYGEVPEPYLAFKVEPEKPKAAKPKAKKADKKAD